MNQPKYEKIIPFIPVISLFLFYLFDPMIPNKAFRGVWIFLILIFISADFFFLIFNSNKLSKEYKTSRYISYSLGLSAFFIYHLRSFLEISLAPGISEELTILPKLRDFLLTLVVILSFLFLIYTVLLVNANQSKISSNALTIRKYGLLQSSFFSFLLLLPLIVGINYITVMKNYNFDMTSVGKYSFSTQSRSIIKNIKKEIQIYAFYPRHLESSGPESSFALSIIRPDVEIILDQLKSINPLFTIKFINADVETDLLGNIGQASNGSILLRTLKENSFRKSPYAEQRISVQESGDLEDIERKLTQAILNITNDEKVIYMTTSNGERFGIGYQNAPNQQINKFVSALNFLNFKIQALGIEQNWPLHIPDDAAALTIIGPTVAFSNEAKETILNYLTKQNGNLFITIDPYGTEQFGWLLEKANLSYKVDILSQPNDKFGILIAKNFKKHPIEEILDKKVLGLIYPYSGFFEKKAFKETPVFDSTILLESGNDTFKDQNSNGKLDSKELKANFQLGYILQFKPPAKNGSSPTSRVVILSGTSWITDQYFSLNVNPDFAANSINWITQREVLTGLLPKKTDIQMNNLTENQKLIVWVIGMFIFPGIIILTSSLFILIRKRQSRIQNL